MNVRLDNVYMPIYNELHENIKQALSYEDELWSAKGYNGAIEVIFEDIEGFETEYFEYNDDNENWTMEQWTNKLTNEIMKRQRVLFAYINSQYLRVELINKIEY